MYVNVANLVISYFYLLQVTPEKILFKDFDHK